MLEPTREALYDRCNKRAARMVSDGACEEVANLLSVVGDASLPVMKALGVPEIGKFLAGDCSKSEALADLQGNTRRFAKRQSTWFRGQAKDWARTQSGDEAFGLLHQLALDHDG